MPAKWINTLAICLGFLWTFFMAITCFVACLFSQSRGRKVQRAWARGILKLMGIEALVYCPENLPKGACILAPNHTSYFDITLIAALPIDFAWVSKVEVAKIPFVGLALKAMGAYLVRRDRSGKDLNVMKAVEDGLRAGDRILIFPEGTRTRTGELLPFKKGAFRTAQNAGVPLCPIAISGALQIAGPGQLPAARGHRVSLRIGPPMMIPPGAPLEDAMGKFREILNDLLSQAGGNAVRL